jgi:transglutaminase-like putative cysteine protease
VAIDRRLGDLGDRDTLTLVIGGIDGVVLPTSPTQTDEVLPDRRRRVTVRRGPGAVVTPAERAQGLAPTAQYDAKHPAIVALAKQIVDGAADDRERTERIVMWVYDNLRKDLSTSLATASQVLDRKHGDCTEHTLLVVALLRAAGIPARDVGGLMYEDTTGRFYWHAWAQAAIEDRWVAVDGAWGQPVADVGHLAFDVNGRGNGGSAMGSITITAEP